MRTLQFVVSVEVYDDLTQKQETELSLFVKTQLPEAVVDLLSDTVGDFGVEIFEGPDEDMFLRGPNEEEL